jgi:hypothetical protein
MAADPEAFEKLADRAELASQELDIREGRAESDLRPLIDASDEDLRLWSTWDPEEDPDLIQELEGGIQLRRARSRSTIKRRMKAEPEGEMPKAAPQEPREEAAPRRRKAKPTPPLLVRARIPLGGGLQQIIGALGVGLAMSGRDPAVGMALQFEAPIAGEKLDQAIQGTPVDRVLQPFARAGNAAKDVGSVIALPFLVGLIERRPELYPVLREPLLRPLVVDMALQLAEAGERAEKRLRAAQRQGGKNVDSDALLAMLFEGRPPTPPDATPSGD